MTVQLLSCLLSILNLKWFLILMKFNLSAKSNMICIIQRFASHNVPFHKNNSVHTSSTKVISWHFEEITTLEINLKWSMFSRNWHLESFQNVNIDFLSELHHPECQTEIVLGWVSWHGLTRRILLWRAMLSIYWKSFKSLHWRLKLLWTCIQEQFRD